MSPRHFIFVISLLLASNIHAQMFGNEPIERQRTYDVQHIKINVRIDLRQKTTRGVTTTTIVPLFDTLTGINIDAVGMNLEYVSIEKGTIPNPFAPHKSEYSYDGKQLRIFLKNKYSSKDTLIWTVVYTITDPEKGLYFIQPDSLFPWKPYQVWTQGEGEDNRYWFPCYDYPNDKATTETIITIDRKYTTLSNGELLKTEDLPDGTRMWHWALDKPHVSYLVMLAAGNFDIIEDKWSDIPILTYVPAGKKYLADSAFFLTADMMEFFSNSIGFKYPWGKIAHVGVVDYVYGAMENTSAIVYYDAVYHDARASIDYTARGLVAHEFAHQWWGDVVTCQNWNEIWLNESFATYFDALYTEHLLGKDEFDYQIMRSGDAAVQQDSTVARKPIYTRDGLGVNTYNKGSVVLNMLRTQLGDENFWKAMNLYITKNQFQCVTTPALIEAVNQAADDPLLDRTPPDYKWFFDEWIYRAGQPEYKVSYSYDDGSKILTLNVSQVQRIDSSSIFLTPAPVEIITATSKVSQSVSSSNQTQSYNFQLDGKPLNVIFNKGNRVLSKLYFSKPKEDWLFQLNNSQDAIDRITAIKGLKDFLNDNSVVEALINSAGNDNFWGVRNESIAVLGKSSSPKAAETLLLYYSKETDSRVKRAILLSLANLKQNCDECIDTQYLLDYMLDKINNEPSYYIIADGISAISRFLGKNKIYDVLIPFMKMDSHVDIIRRRVIPALDSTYDRRSMELFVKYAVIGNYASLRNAALNGLDLYLREPGIIDFLNARLSDKNRSTKFTVLRLLEKAKNSSSVPFIESLLQKTNDDELIKRAREVLNVIR